MRHLLSLFSMESFRLLRFFPRQNNSLIQVRSSIPGILFNDSIQASLAMFCYYKNLIMSLDISKNIKIFIYTYVYYKIINLVIQFWPTLTNTITIPTIFLWKILINLEYEDGDKFKYKFQNFDEIQYFYSIKMLESI